MSVRLEPRKLLATSLAALLGALALSNCEGSHATGPAAPDAALMRNAGARTTDRIKYFNVQPANAGLLDITTGPDYALWFTEANANRIGRFKSGKLKYYELNTSNGQPAGITTGFDGAIWFAEQAGKIGRIMTDGTGLQEYSVPFPAYAITNGFDNAVWFTMHDGTSTWIGRIGSDGKVKKYKVQLKNDTIESGITAGRDGFYWFTLKGANAVGRITSAGAIRTFTNGDGDSQPFSIVANGGSFFVGEENGVAQLQSRGTFTECPLPPSTGSSVTGIARGIGTVWFVVDQGDYIGTIAGGCAMQLYKIKSPSSSGIWDVTAGPDDNLWFTDAVENRIGRFTPPSPSPSP
jgi:virginiamycin B lyase